MKKTTTNRYDVAGHLRNPEEMAAYLEACLEEAYGDAAFIAKALSSGNDSINVELSPGAFLYVPGNFRCLSCLVRLGCKHLVS